jgi:DNA-binding transcriptional LysR family regulator
MDLRQVEAFVAVSTLGSFRAAANRLNLTQPAISARIASLEQELGETLFIRDSRPVALSDRAKQILPLAEQMLELAHQVKPTQTPGLTRSVEKLRIGTNSSLVTAWLPELSWHLHMAIPNATIEFEVGASHRLRDRMIRGALDVCFMHAPHDIPGARRERLCEIDTIWAARPDVVHSRELSVQDLTSYPIITFGKEADPYRELERSLREIGCWPLPHISTNYADMIINTIKRAPFIGTVLRDSIQLELQRNELVEIECDVKLSSYTIHACYSLTGTSRMAKTCTELTSSFVNQGVRSAPGVDHI